jgi:hypothetical protein
MEEKMKLHDITEQAYKNGYQRGFEDGKRAALTAVSVTPNISDATLYALYKMDQKVHTGAEDRSCVNCMDGGIDMPHCAECDRANGFRYFRKKV